ncbi:MAG: hypothetical protein HQ567_04790 [Candidatus Nealsonbacteria bacterium]|nr:hypothetical protein [Candidatus Nealsonbacteria bacterium]
MSKIRLRPMQATDRTELAQMISASMYTWGAQNCDIGPLQTRGPRPPIHGVSVPTFLPETA